MTLGQILAQVASINVRRVTVTGGEPLQQANAYSLLTLLCDSGYLVSLETGGSYSIAPVDQRVTIVLDIKTPGSGEQQSGCRDNWQHLKPSDQIKFVITSRQDYEWAKALLQQEPLLQDKELLFSAAIPLLEPRLLAEWIVQDRLPVRFQLQLHKVLWPEQERGR